MLRRRIASLVVTAAIGAAGLLSWHSIAAATGVPAAGRIAAARTTGAESTSLPAWKAGVLGLVEGITEYLPISSTGHLHVVQRALDVGTTPATEAAADTYTITIQAGAIAAVLVLYRRRIADVARGALGRSDTGRRVLVAVVVAFVPAALTGVLFDDAIKDHLLEVGPIAAAWIVGALAIWSLVPRVQSRAVGRSVAALDEITVRQASLIGAAQVLALWPGTSRSLVTIVAALAVGLSMSAAVEFSFVLGLVTLGAATAYDATSSGGELVDTFGLATPLLGLAVAFVSAVVAVRWMVSYLQTRDLRIFAVYRVLAAVVALALLAGDIV